MSAKDVIAGTLGVVGGAVGIAGAVFAGADSSEMAVAGLAGAVGGALTPAAIGGLGQGVMSATPATVKFGAKYGKEAIGAIGTASLYAGDFAGTMVGTAARTGTNIMATAAKSFSDNFLRESDKSFLGYKFNKKGMLLMAGIAGISSILGGGDAYLESRRGMPAQETLMTSTPNLDNFQYRAAETYGAGGDLVFALNKNRRG